MNTANDEVEDIITGSFNCMTQSKVGNIQIGAGTKLVKVNPYILETSDFDVSSATYTKSATPDFVP